MLRLCFALAMGLTLAGCGPTAPCPCPGQEVEHRPAGDKHHFGLDWPRKPPGEIDVKLPPAVVDAFQRWGLLADKLEAGAWWTTFTIGAAAAVVCCLVVALVVVGVRTR